MLHIVKFKGCKRCGGDLFLEHDPEGAYIFCLQCSAIYERHSAQQAIKHPEPKKIPVC